MGCLQLLLFCRHCCNSDGRSAALFEICGYDCCDSSIEICLARQSIYLVLRRGCWGWVRNPGCSLILAVQHSRYVAGYVQRWKGVVGGYRPGRWRGSYCGFDNRLFFFAHFRIVAWLGPFHSIFRLQQWLAEIHPKASIPAFAGKFGWLRSRPAASAKHTRYPSDLENLRTPASGPLSLLDRNARPDSTRVSPHLSPAKWLTTLSACSLDHIQPRPPAKTTRTSVFVPG